MDKKLLDDETFNDKLEELGNDVEELTMLCKSISKIAVEVNSSLTFDNYEQLTDLKSNIDDKIVSVKRQLVPISASSINKEKWIRQFEKINDATLKTILEYEKNKSEYERIIRVSKDKPEIRNSLSLNLSSFNSNRNTGEVEVPTMMVFNQSEFAEKREKDIEKLNADARQIHGIAKDINTKIYEGDDKLDAITHKFDKEVKANLVKANEDLATTEELSKKRVKNYCFFIWLIIVLVTILTLSLYFMFR